MKEYEAAALARLGVHPDLYASLTDEQIRTIYAHPADEKTGKLTPPPEVAPGAASPEAQRAFAAEVMAAFGIPQSRQQEVLRGGAGTDGNKSGN